MNRISEIFDIAPQDIKTLDVQTLIPETVYDVDTSESDFEYSRKVQKEIIESGRAALETAMRIANESEQPRAIETLAMMLKTVSDVNGQLVDFTKDKKDKNSNALQVGTQNIIHLGSGNTINSLLDEKIKNGN